MIRKLLVAHTIASMDTSAGGPVRSVAGLCAGLAAGECETHLFYFSDDTSSAREKFGLEKVVLHPVPTSARGYVRQFGVLRYARELSRELDGRPFDAIQDHGIWLPTNVATAVVAARKRVPRVVSVHGTLAKWAIGFKRAKKVVAWHAYQERLLRTAKVIRATSLAEYKDVRALGLAGPVAVIPNGVSLPTVQRRRQPGETPQRNAIFVGRIHPVKGLANLIQAWALIRPASWRLTIAGPVEEKHDIELRKLIVAHGLQGAVELRDEIDDPSKWRLIQESNLVVLPSFTENFGMVVAEGLSAGVPVITTHGTPWEELVEHRCGWWVAANAEGLATALRDATSRSDQELLDMGVRGRQLIMRSYLWSAVSDRMVELYHWLRNGGDRPRFVKVD